MNFLLKKVLHLKNITIIFVTNLKLMLDTYTSREEFKKIGHILIYFSIFLFAYVTFICYFSLFQQNFYIHQVIVAIAYKIHGKIPNTLLLNFLLMLFSTAGVMTFVTTKTISPERKEKSLRYGIILGVAFMLWSVLEWFSYMGFLGLIFHTVLYFSALVLLLDAKKRVTEDLKQDRRQETESQFDQQREIIETPYSVNIPYGYTYLKEKFVSWINIVNPFRAILVGGTPGSGKSFAILEEILRQFLKKTFTGVNYDYKFPTLSVKIYNYLKWYEGNYHIKPKFYLINFDNVEYSHRCNPIGEDTLKSIADAEENTKALMLNINKTWIDKEGEFFTDSANVFTAIMMWYLKLVSEKYDYDVCTLPHLISLSSFDSTEILFFVLREYEDLKSRIQPFNEALEKGALEQLAGQVASAGIALNKISSPAVDFIMSGNDFSFDLNNPTAPKILTIGNNPDRELVYSAPLGLILTKLSKTLNRQKRLPSMFVVDEFPTTYIRGIDNLIATARSNKVSVVLGFQSFAQVVANYGKEVSDKIVKIIGTRIVGQLFDDDAELMSKSIGKQKVLQRSYNYSTNEVSENQQVAMEDIVPPSRIAQFSQGTFAGVVADDFKYKEDNKVFFGEIQPPLELKEVEDDIPLPKIYDFAPENLEEKVKSFLEENQKILEKLSEAMRKQNIIDWNEIIEEKTTSRNLINYMVERYKFDYMELKHLAKEFSFKEKFTKLIIKKYKENDEISSQDFLSEEEVSSFIRKELVRQGFIDQNIKKILKLHKEEINKDIYRIMAMEIQDLNIVDRLMENQKTKRVSKSLFNKIINSDKMKNEHIKKEYEKIINQLN